MENTLRFLKQKSADFNPTNYNEEDIVGRHVASVIAQFAQDLHAAIEADMKVRTVVDGGTRIVADGGTY